MGCVREKPVSPLLNLFKAYLSDVHSRVPESLARLSHILANHSVWAVSNKMCECDAWMRKVQGLYYCENCRRFYELRRVKGV
ncbi:MAG: hypothetical protein QXD61_10690 [Candidatus Caldarchaeum sp.]